MTSDRSPAQTLQRALAHQAAGRLADAAQLYQTILATEPEHPQANHHLGLLAMQTGQVQAALPHFRAALAANPNQGRYWLSYIDALFQAGAADMARQVLAQGRQQGLRGDAVESLAARWAPLAPGPQETDLLTSLFTEQRYPQAEALARDMTLRFPMHAFGWKVLGALLKLTGRLNEALAPMQKAAALSPADTGAHINVGIALKELGRLHEAEASYRKAIEIQEDFADCHNDLGNLLQEMGRLDEAQIHCRRAIQIQPEDARAHNNLGVILQKLGRLDEATLSLQRALQLKPEYAEAHSNLGNICQQFGQHDKAQACYRRAIELQPGCADAHTNLGVTLRELGRLEEAAACARRALQLQPGCVQAHTNLGVVLRELGQLDNSVASLVRALQIDPMYAPAHANLGTTFKELGQLVEAEASYRRALQISPDDADAECSLGHTLLQCGKLREGWRHYEHRWEGGLPKPTRQPTTLPQWRGEAPRSGDGILIFGEQGMGDKLQFSRYLPLLTECFRGGVAVVVNRPLLKLLRQSFPAVQVFDGAPPDQRAWQWQCPLLSLPLAFNTSLDTIPNQTPYLSAEPVKTAHWQGRIAALNLPSAAQKIGIVWKPGNLMKNASLRALTLRQLAPLLQQPGCVWFSLQKEPDDSKLPWVTSGKLIDWADEFNDFADTAALLMHLDLVIAVDTAVVHLAGALGKPVWLLNRYASEWRWMRDRDDSPWYPTMRIFTQRSAGDWDEVVRRVGVAVAELN